MAGRRPVFQRAIGAGQPQGNIPNAAEEARQERLRQVSFLIVYRLCFYSVPRFYFVAVE